MSMILVGVMGPGEGATDEEMAVAFELGGAIAREGWVLLTGGRRAGVMDAASRGARAGKGIVVGILPGTDSADVSSAVDIPVITGMNEARNAINVLSSRVLIFVGMNAGTASELALALKAGRPAILLCQRDDVASAFAAMGAVTLKTASDAAEAVKLARNLLAADAENSAASSRS